MSVGAGSRCVLFLLNHLTDNERRLLTQGSPLYNKGDALLLLFFWLLVLLFSKHILAFSSSLLFYAAYVDDDVQSQAIKRSLLTGAMEDAGFGYASLLPIKVKEQNLIVP